LVAEKDQVLGWYDNEDREILRSSISTEPYTAKWYRRENNPEDPWISLNDHWDELVVIAFDHSDDHMADYTVTS